MRAVVKKFKNIVPTILTIPLGIGFLMILFICKSVICILALLHEIIHFLLFCICSPWVYIKEKTSFLWNKYFVPYNKIVCLNKMINWL